MSKQKIKDMSIMRTLLLLITLLLSATLFSQEMKVKRVKKVEPSDKGSYLLSGVVPGKKLLLVSETGYQGLSLLDIRKGRLTAVTAGEGAGYEPAVTADGRQLYYRSDSYIDNVKHSAIYRYDIATGEGGRVTAAGRDVPLPVASGNRVLLMDGTRMMTEHTGTPLKSGEAALFVLTEEMRPVLYHGTRGRVLTPNGDGFYIWVSLSPDATMLLYNYQGKGTFISDLEGNILHRLGRVNAPRWFSDRIVIGMDDHDDGYRITSSDLVFYSLREKERVNLTATPDRSEMFPFPVSARQIAFCTDKGEIFIMKVKVR